MAPLRVAPLRVALVGADDEYRSEVTMPLLAAGLRRDAVVEASVAFPADPASGALDVERRDHIAGLAQLEQADVAVFFLRWRELPPAEWAVIEAYFLAGRPLVGLRTSTHMVRGVVDRDGASLDDELPRRVFGQRWISHHGHDSRTRVLPPRPEVAGHPVLRGIRGGFEVPSWLYDVEPLPEDCLVLLWGEVVADGKEPVRQPIVWVREATPTTPRPFPGRGDPARRMAFTTLGHPGDFASAEVRRLVEQMVLWAGGRESEIPATGLAATLREPYLPPPTR